ncbi:MAG TPA: menaquinone biosynthesis decarboxylase [Nitrososphaeraceae archaeon]|jgi:4-hydroxy-3-polyprenylbenzoate decarboxylase
MPIESLAEFVDALEKANELKRIRTRVSTELEIAEILRRLMYNRDRPRPAILFENVEGSDMPVLGNAFGSIKRLKIALETDDFSDIGNRISDLTKMKMPAGVLSKIKMLPRLSEIADYGPRTTESGPVTDIILNKKEASFDLLPILKSFSGDAGKFITFGLTVSRHPETGVRNMGVYRIQIIDPKKGLMHWQVHKRGAQHFELAKELKSKIEVAIVIGADPACVFAAVAPVPEGMDKFLFAGIARKKGTKLVKCRSVNLEVPAYADIVLEGYVDPEETRIEGPFGDHTGYYTPPEPYPVFNLTGIMHRKKPIYLTTVVGKPVLEDAYIGKVIERSFLPLIKIFQPEVIDFSMPPAGWFQGLAIVSIKKQYPGQAKKVMLGLWGLGQLALTKMLVVVDPDVDVQNMDDVIWALTTRMDPKRDIVIIDFAPTDTLDPASPLENLGSKIGIDATTKWKEEGYSREIQQLAKVDRKTREYVDARWKEYGVE